MDTIFSTVRKFVAGRSDSRAFIYIALAFAILSSCSERNRNNPFDPNSNVQDLISLNLSVGADFVELNWFLTQEVTDLQGYNIYRSTGDADTLQLYQSIDATSSSFVDNNVEQGLWYNYEVTAAGVVVESKPSNRRRALLGAGTYWILSSNDSDIIQTRYDLLEEVNVYSICDYPNDWVISPNDSLVWVVYELFGNGGLCSLSKNSGTFTRYFVPEMDFPAAIAMKNFGDELYILDTGLSSLFVFSGGLVTAVFELPDNQSYLNLDYSSETNKVLVLGDSSVLDIDPAFGTFGLPLIEFAPGYSGKDLLTIGNVSYVLSSSADAQLSQIYTVSPENNISVIDFDAELYQIGYDWVSEYYYVAQNIPSAEDKVLQLSHDGTRLLELSAEFSLVKQITINPFDRSVLVVDGTDDEVVLFKPDGTFVSNSSDPGGTVGLNYPLRIHVE